MSSSPTVEKPEKQDNKKLAAFKAWLSERNTWLRQQNWKRVTGENSGLRIAAVAGSVGLVLAFWMLGSWIYRSTRPKTAEPQIEGIVANLEELPPVTEPLPNLQVNLDEPEPQPEFKRPVVVVDSKLKTSLQLAAAEPEPLPNPPAHAEPKPIAPPQQSAAGLSDPFESEPKAAPTTESPTPPKAQPEPPVFEKLLVLQKPAGERRLPEPPVDEKPIAEKPLVEEPIAKKPIVEKPIDEKIDTEPVEPVVPIEEKPQVVAEKAATPPTREDESFGSQENRVVIERGTAIVPAAATPEMPPVTEAEPPPVKPATPVTPPAPPADELPVRMPAEPPVTEVKPEPQPEAAPPEVKKEKVEAATLKDDEPFGSSTPDQPPQSPRAAPKKPEVKEEKVEPKVEAPIATPPEKPVEDKPVPVKPSVVEPEPSTATSPFPDDPPASANPPKPPVETSPAPVKKDEEADIAALPEKREPRPEPPAPDRLPRKPAEPAAPPAEPPKAEPASRPQPEPPRTTERVSPPAAPPQIDFELTAPLQAKRGATFEIGFKVTNIGTTDIDGLVFSIRLPASLKHRAGRELEYRIDRLAVGQSHAAQMHVTAENAEMALIRAEMVAGRYRLATSDRQINVHGTSPTGFIQRTSAEVPAPQQPRPQFLPWSMQMGGWRPCECEGF